MRLMKMMDYDSKVANYWQQNVSEKIDYKSCCGCMAVNGYNTIISSS
jgi:hypothetical protein